jgi:bifunctional DNA-binding transcriptional regulator/antitoxin component of YhaV-PrlF toxin-antitoxin module
MDGIKRRNQNCFERARDGIIIIKKVGKKMFQLLFLNIYKKSNQKYNQISRPKTSKKPRIELLYRNLKKTSIS